MAVNERPKLQTLILGILKDKASLVKAATLFSPARAAVIRATTHSAVSPPPEHRISVVVAHSSECSEALTARLSRTKSAAVALKCLIITHSALSHGETRIANFRTLNLSAFQDRSAWELSAWTRWYALAVEQSLAVSSSLGHSLYPREQLLDCSNNFKVVSSLAWLSSSKLLSGFDVLVEYAERASEAPVDSMSSFSIVEARRNGLLYEVLRLVGEDYRLVQREILARAKEFVERGDRSLVSSGELTRFVSCLKRLEDCKERLLFVFLKRKKDDDFWGFVGGLRVKAVERLLIEKRDRLIGFK